ncbi:MAG: metalloregulator ArsR/SmtB family transcription factor [Actinobacteria bacterium]|nr:metalloregulator ArsR/SmtB family transcription factor [Actinomycetota bacterium]
MRDIGSVLSYRWSSIYRCRSIGYGNIDGCQYVGRLVERKRRCPVQVQEIERCCEPVFTEALGQDEAEDLAAAFKVLSDPARLRLLSLVANADGGEVCACDLVEPLGRSQPTVSHHLKVLAEAGLVEREKRGRWAWYRAVPERIAVLRDSLEVVP